MKKLILYNLTVVVLFFFFDMIVVYVDKYATESTSEIITFLWAIALLLTVIILNRKSFSNTGPPFLKYLFRIMLIVFIFIISWTIAYIFNGYY